MGCRMVLYPLSAFRAMNAAALKVYQSIMTHGHQREVIDTMQTRNELYDFFELSRFRAEARRAVCRAKKTPKTLPLLTNNSYKYVRQETSHER